MLEKWTLLISGKVQGVFYRQSLVDFIHGNMPFFRGESGVSGFVQNLSSGQVEAILEGDPQDLQKILDYCYQGPQMAMVENIEVSKEALSVAEFQEFSIKR
jgi:acylphosphatase